jgi:hypothetical protein
MKIDLPEPRFRARFDQDGVLIKASSEREEANRLARLDKERRFIADASPHRPNGGQRGGAAVAAVALTIGNNSEVATTGPMDTGAVKADPTMDTVKNLISIIKCILELRRGRTRLEIHFSELQRPLERPR